MGPLQKRQNLFEIRTCKCTQTTSVTEVAWQQAMASPQETAARALLNWRETPRCTMPPESTTKVASTRSMPAARCRFVLIGNSSTRPCNSKNRLELPILQISPLYPLSRLLYTLNPEKLHSHRNPTRPITPKERCRPLREIQSNEHRRLLKIQKANLLYNLIIMSPRLWKPIKA